MERDWAYLHALNDALEGVEGADRFCHASSPLGTERDRRYVFNNRLFHGNNARGRAIAYLETQVVKAGRPLPSR